MSELSEQEIRVKMAELAGWRYVHHKLDNHFFWWNPIRRWFDDVYEWIRKPGPDELAARLDNLPDYPHDLNAVQEVFRGLSEPIQYDAIEHLLEAMAIETEPEELHGLSILLTSIALATPLQWCKAILAATDNPTFRKAIG